MVFSLWMGILPDSIISVVWQKNIEDDFGHSIKGDRMGSLELRISNQNRFLAVGTAPGDLLFMDILTGSLL